MLKFRHELPKSVFLPDRLEWMCSQCAGKRVIDIGCVDSGLLEERVAVRDLAHSRISAVAMATLGVDADAGGIERMRQMNFSNVLVADPATASDSVIGAARRCLGGCDVIVCGEVLEHVLDAGTWLKGIGNVARTFNAEVILTIPNAFSVRGLLSIIAGTELVHDDHKYYFSWHTARRLLEDCGFEIIECHFYTSKSAISASKMNIVKWLLRRAIFSVTPQLSEGIAIKAIVSRGRYDGVSFGGVTNDALV